jgi:Rrf2 family protein
VKITATEEYGLRCMLQLALRAGETVSLTELVAAEGIAPPFAAKVLLRLRRAGLVQATRGRNGGYALADAAEAITVARILKALGGRLFDSEFCRKHPHPVAGSCARMGNCSLRPVWAHLDALLERFFAQTTLADLVAGEPEARRHLQERFSLLVMPPSAAAVKEA